MGGIFSLARDLFLISAGFVFGFYLCDKQHRSSVSFQGIGKKLDSAISDIERELKGSPPPSFETYATDAFNIVARPVAAMYHEVCSWFSGAGFPSAEFTR